MMLVLRRFRPPVHALIRGNATLQPTPTGTAPPDIPAQVKSAVEPAASSVSPPLPTPTASSSTAASNTVKTSESSVENTELPKTKGRSYKTRRPHISLDRPREWNRPLIPGVLPAYDEALRIITRDSESIKKEISDLHAVMEQAKTSPDTSQEVMREFQEKMHILQVQSEINLPDVRWKAANGMGDLSKPVFRHLLEQKWRNEGALDLLMERIHQMNVVPDLLPSLHPSFDMRITFPEPPPQSVYLRTRVKRKHQQVEPGVFLLPQQTRKPPRVYTTVFHPDTRYYTLLMLDADAPDPENERYRTYLHWMQPNIALSASSASLEFSMTHTPYIPPHPQQGTPYHRYVLLLLPHSSPSEQLSIPVPTAQERAEFHLRTFMEQYELDGSRGGAAHMWREVWDEDVSTIYRVVLKMNEPRYGRQPKADPYAAIRGVKRFI